MTNFYVESVNVNLFGGAFNQVLRFSRGLNLISGTNGTGKTSLLGFIRANWANPALMKMIATDTPTGMSAARVQAISPRRNSQRTSIEQIINRFRNENKNFETALQEFAQQQINDTSYVAYPTLAELFYLMFEHLRKDGQAGTSAMDTIAEQFNEVIRQIFAEYRLIARWDGAAGRPSISVQKSRTVSMEIDQLSLGEQSILALALHVFCARDNYDVLLIDEPEVHLNWSLERRLFGLLSWLAERFQKQIIVVTHSRMVFDSEFAGRATFLDWDENGKVEVTRVPNRRLVELLAGEAVNLLKVGDFERTTFFVEDRAHELAVVAIAKALNVEIVVTQCGTSANVKSMFKLSKADGGWANCVFLVDGDNQGSSFPGDEAFITLDRYCMQNFFVDADIVSVMYGLTPDAVRSKILAAIIASKEALLRQNARFFGFLLDRLTVDDVSSERLKSLDVSESFKAFLRELGETSEERYFERYAAIAVEAPRISEILPKKLVEMLQLVAAASADDVSAISVEASASPNPAAIAAAGGTA